MLPGCRQHMCIFWHAGSFMVLHIGKVLFLKGTLFFAKLFSCFMMYTPRMCTGFGAFCMGVNSRPDRQVSARRDPARRRNPPRQAPAGPAMIGAAILSNTTYEVSLSHDSSAHVCVRQCCLDCNRRNTCTLCLGVLTSTLCSPASVKDLKQQM